MTRKLVLRLQEEGDMKKLGVVATLTLWMMTLCAKPSWNQVQHEREVGMSQTHDFDFLYGSWNVQHRRLKHRLAHSHDWEEFTGTCVVQPLLGSQANVDDNVLDAPAGTYRAASLRALNPQTQQWSIWWLDSRTADKLGPPVVGAFHNGIGTFYANDVWEGKAIIVRFTWSDIEPHSAKWQQAFSADGGKTWEVNWTMEFRRKKDG